MGEQNKENKSHHALYIALIALLLGGLVFTSLKLKKQKETIIVSENQRDEVAALKAEMEVKFKDALKDIENYKIENSGLDSILNLKELELNSKRAKINELLQQASTNKNALAQAQQLIKELENDKITFKRTIDSLISTNEVLYTKNQDLDKELTVTKEEKEKIAYQKSALEEEKSKMIEKINKASILSVANIECTPMRLTKKGKEEDVSKAKDAEKIRICFDLLQNKIAPKGPTELIVRIVAPEGNTIQIQSLGSGTFVEATTGNEVPYTYSISPSFENETKQVCSYWKQNYSFVPGKYSVEIYQKGLLIGQSGFSLK